jgi:hypothetical protein
MWTAARIVVVAAMARLPHMLTARYAMRGRSFFIFRLGFRIASARVATEHARSPVSSCLMSVVARPRVAIACFFDAMSISA